MNKNCEEKYPRFAVIGSGSWGSGIGLLLSRKGYPVVCWARDEKLVEQIQKSGLNEKYIGKHRFPENCSFTTDLEKACENVRCLVMCVPSHGLREVFRKIVPFLDEQTRIVSAVKGIENDSLMTMSRVMTEELGGKRNPVGVLSGPSFAKEVAKGCPTAVTVGFEDKSISNEVQQYLATEFFRVYVSDDVPGLEISGALKNIIAIATGICDGLGYGLNTRAALITRGLAEIQRLGTRLGAKKETFAGLSGMGDLILTCTGELSRNRTVGIEIGKGKKLLEIQKALGHVAEGVKTTESGMMLAKKHGVEMPILEQVYKIIYEGVEPAKAVKRLLKRELGEE